MSQSPRSIAVARALLLSTLALYVPLGAARGDVTDPSWQESAQASRIHVAALMGPSGLPWPTPGDPQTPIDEVRTHLQKREFDDALEAANKLIRENPGNPDGHNLQGGAYLGKGDYANARKSFERAIELRPDSNLVLTNLAQLDLLEKDFASARKRYQAVLAKNPKDVVAMVGMAQVEANSKNEKQGLAWLDKAKSADPKAWAPRRYLSAYYLRSRQYSRAMSELTDAQEHFPDNPQILDLLGQAQAGNGQTAAALLTYRKLVSVAPDSPVGYYRLAGTMITSGDVSGARENLRKAIRLRPEFAEAHYALAALDVKAKRYDEAMTRARELQKTTPKSPAGFVIEGDVLFAQQRYADAATAYEKAWSLEQASPTVLKLHAAHAKAGNAKAADARMQAWLKDHPDDPRALLYMAAENLKEGRNKLAIEQYEAVLKKRPDNVLALNNLAHLYQQQKDPRALPAAEQARKLAPDSARVADTLGWILVEQGKTKRGLDLLQQAAERAPQAPEIRYHLAVAFAKSGDKARARKELENLLQGDEKFAQREAAEQLLKQL
jgi:putative PEP-CTERM system TPR-repeat lipoprotein